MPAIDDPTAPDLDPPAASPSVGRRIARILALVVFFGSFGVWIYLFSGLAAGDGPDRLADDDYGRLAQALCTEANDDVAAMPGALEARDEFERADQIVAATDRYVVMVDDLETLVDHPDVSLPLDDERLVERWIGDWRVLLDDRYAHAERVAADPTADFFVTQDGGFTVDDRITDFTKFNLMTACGAPGDVG